MCCSVCAALYALRAPCCAVQDSVTDALVQIADLVLAVSQLDAFSSLSVPLSLLPTLGSDIALDCRGVKAQEVSVVERVPETLVQRLARQAKVCLHCLHAVFPASHGLLCDQCYWAPRPAARVL